MSTRRLFLIKLPLLILGFSLLTLANATVLYKKVDKDGKVTFTDKPSDDAELITVDSKRNFISRPDSDKRNNTQSDKTLAPEPQESHTYDIFAIDSPVNSQSVRSPNGSVTVFVGISPQLDANHSIRLHLNGQSVGQDQKIPYFSLTDIEEDTYELLAVIINDETEEVIQTSAPVTFNLVIAD